MFIPKKKNQNDFVKNQNFRVFWYFPQSLRKIITTIIVINNFLNVSTKPNWLRETILDVKDPIKLAQNRI